MGKRFLGLVEHWWLLFLISSLSLFMEIAVIRWLAAEIRLLAYFKNLTLLSAFLGLAIGFALVGKGRDYRFSFGTVWGGFVLLVIAVGLVSVDRPIFYPGGNDEYLWNVASFSFWVLLLLFLASVLIFFLSNLFLFIPLGQATGVEMAKHPPVQAYIVNILASLFGIWLFSLFSYLQTPPVVWFGTALVGLSVFYFHHRKLSIATLLIFLATIVAVGFFGRGTIWSPYNRLNISEFTFNREKDGQEVKLGYLLNVQQTFHQSALNLSDDFITELRAYGEDSRADVVEEVSFAYSIPYLLASPGSRTLVVGSGMGNDVAAALRNGVGQVDAVEIDPAILQLGQDLHPERPYQDPRVAVIVDDARSYFNKTRDQYDLVVFGLLDSHTLLSGLSSVRLDSFVYTIDSFAEVRRLLKPDGHVVITFATNDWIEERLGRMMAKVFGEANVSIHRGTLGTTFVAGAVDSSRMATARLSHWTPNPDFDDLPLGTDDWPYLYMRTRQVPAGYWQALLLIALICWIMIARSFPETLRPDWHFWLLGAAFLLIEFKSVTELALLFGTTWFVNSLAISGVLMMALLANLYVVRRPHVDLRWVYTLLFISLMVSYFFPLEWLAGFSSVGGKALISTILLSLPLLFAGVVFSESLRRAGETARPLASNFSGSAVGGLLEYTSLLWGIKSLYGLAVLMYLGALQTAIRQKLLRG